MDWWVRLSFWKSPDQRAQASKREEGGKLFEVVAEEAPKDKSEGRETETGPGAQSPEPRVRGKGIAWGLAPSVGEQPIYGGLVAVAAHEDGILWPVVSQTSEETTRRSRRGEGPRGSG